MEYARKDLAGRQAEIGSKLRCIQLNTLCTYDEYRELKDMAAMFECTMSDILLSAIRESRFTYELRRAAARREDVAMVGDADR